VTEPSADAIQPDHLAWWTAFSELVSKMPKQAEQCRLSDDPIHRVHGSMLSISDCAMRAIDLAYEEELDQVAHKYEEQAGRMMASYDRHVRSKVSACMDKEMIKYILITAGCALFAFVFLLINSRRESSSVGLMAIVVISLSVSLASTVLFVVLFIRKRRILGSGSHARNRTGPEMP
jgi:hypothetical protein